MKIILIGCVKSSELFLKKLIEINAEIVGVITKEKSNFNSDFVDLGEICRENNIDYLYVKNVNDSLTKEYIRERKADLILCLGWSQLLDKEILDIPKLGSIGFHPAELPNNRGRHPLIWALVLGLRRTASTLFFLEATADSGQIISQQYIDIDYLDDAMSLYDKVMLVAVEQLEEVLPKIQNNTLDVHKQALGKGNVWRKRGKEDGKIDWRMSSRSIYNLVRGLTKPYVGAHFVLDEKEYKVWRVKEIFKEDYENIEPGKVVKVYSSNNFIVKAGDNLIQVLECDGIKLKEGDYL